jgi:N-acetylglucosamine-6-phosphate deacetylase
MAAVAEGLEGVTHLFNAMSPQTSRAPGTVGAALAEDALWAGIIADGHHVHPANIRLARQAKPAGRLVLVSDAMATVGGSHAAFSLYGEEIRQSSGKLVNSAGALAGSAIGMIDAVAVWPHSIRPRSSDWTTAWGASRPVTGPTWSTSTSSSAFATPGWPGSAASTADPTGVPARVDAGAK